MEQSKIVEWNADAARGPLAAITSQQEREEGGSSFSSSNHQLKFFLSFNQFMIERKSLIGWFLFFSSKKTSPCRPKQTHQFHFIFD